jgi:hypothetical protein
MVACDPALVTLNRILPCSAFHPLPAGYLASSDVSRALPRPAVLPSFDGRRRDGAQGSVDELGEARGHAIAVLILPRTFALSPSLSTCGPPVIWLAARGIFRAVGAGDSRRRWLLGARWGGSTASPDGDILFPSSGVCPYLVGQ